VVREFADDGAAHRVADQGRRLDLTIVEEPGRRVCEVGYVERVDGSSAASEPGQVWDEGVEFVRQSFGGRQQVPAREAEPVQVQHHRSVRRLR
jgi:hypothetical protein